jgi:hypothetical protein
MKLNDPLSRSLGAALIVARSGIWHKDVLSPNVRKTHIAARGAKSKLFTLSRAASFFWRSQKNPRLWQPGSVGGFLTPQGPQHGLSDSAQGQTQWDALQEGPWYRRRRQNIEILEPVEIKA